VEDFGDGAGAADDLAAQFVGFAFEAPPAFGPAGVGFAVGATMAGVLPELFAQPVELLLPAVAFAAGVVCSAGGAFAFEVTDFAADAGVLCEVAKVALH